MKKIINSPENFVNEMLEGIYSAHSDMVKPVDKDPRCFVATNSVKGKVGIATGASN